MPPDSRRSRRKKLGKAQVAWGQRWHAPTADAVCERLAQVKALPTIGQGCCKQAPTDAGWHCWPGYLKQGFNSLMFTTTSRLSLYTPLFVQQLQCLNICRESQHCYIYIQTYGILGQVATTQQWTYPALCHWRPPPSLRKTRMTGGGGWGHDLAMNMPSFVSLKATLPILRKTWLTGGWCGKGGIQHSNEHTQLCVTEGHLAQPEEDQTDWGGGGGGAYGTAMNIPSFVSLKATSPSLRKIRLTGGGGGGGAYGTAMNIPSFVSSKATSPSLRKIRLTGGGGGGGAYGTAMNIPSFVSSKATSPSLRKIRLTGGGGGGRIWHSNEHTQLCVIEGHLAQPEEDKTDSGSSQGGGQQGDQNSAQQVHVEAALVGVAMQRCLQQGTATAQLVVQLGQKSASKKCCTKIHVSKKCSIKKGASKKNAAPKQV